MLAKLNKYRPHIFFILALFFGCFNDFLAFIYAHIIHEYDIEKLIKLSSFNVPLLGDSGSSAFVILTILVFSRFFFSALIVLPFLQYKNLIKTSSVFITNNFYRSLIGLLSIILTYIALASSTIVIVNCIFWTIPIFGMLMNRFFLKEEVPKNQLTLCLISTICLVFFALYSNNNNRNIIHSMNGAYFAIVAAILFAIQDIMIKKATNQNYSKRMSIFSFNISAIVLIFLVLSFVHCFIINLNIIYYSIYQICLFFLNGKLQLLYLFFLLGISCNLLQFCLFKAFSETRLNNISALRYCDILFSFYFTGFFHKQTFNPTILVGVFALFLSTYFASRQQQISA